MLASVEPQATAHNVMHPVNGMICSYIPKGNLLALAAEQMTTTLPHLFTILDSDMT